VWKYILVTLYCAGALGATLLIIRYNTIIHPFTLADNRHYVFYVFRYTILRHPIFRYILAPVYLVCGWGVYLTLCCPPTLQTYRLKTTKKQKLTTSSPSKTRSVRSSAGVEPNSSPLLEGTMQPDTSDTEGTTTSFVLIFFITTALSLITAPLVEPRYFIIPWVIWRLHVPSLAPTKSEFRAHQPQKIGGKDVTSGMWILKKIKLGAYQNHDYRLWLETTWFFVINVVTGFIFLYRGFSWPQEPGQVQRFMW